jgi:hypothetical protein
MKGSWIPPNLEGMPTMKVDPYGFWLVRHAVRQPSTTQPFVYPSQVSQVSVFHVVPVITRTT